MGTAIMLTQSRELGTRTGLQASAAYFIRGRRESPTMAAFKQHVTFSSVIGIGYAGALGYLGVEWTHSALAGALCGFAGMLPDLDSDTGKPVKELFGITAVLAPMLLIHRIERAGMSPEGAILFAAVAYATVRFGLAAVFRRLTVHRGMFHSIPAAIIAAEIVFLSHRCHEEYGRLTLSGGVLIGYLSHLVLDEIWAVDARGLIPKFNKAAGSACKFFSQSIPATLTTYVILTALTYGIGVELGYIEPIHLPIENVAKWKKAEFRIPNPEFRIRNSESRIGNPDQGGVSGSLARSQR
jgi:membrane-bound metal-dependent hydrolase YbcI (DUF457 family)